MDEGDFGRVDKRALENQVEEKENLAQKDQRETADQAQRASIALGRGGDSGRCRLRKCARGHHPCLATREFTLQDAEELPKPKQDFPAPLPKQMSSRQKDQNSDQPHSAQVLCLP